MKVLILINCFGLGGAEKLEYDISRKLSGIDDMEIYLYSLTEIRSELEKKIFHSFDNSRVRAGSFAKSVGKKRVRTVFRIRRFCRKNRIDIVHSNCPSPDFFSRSARLFGSGTKTVVTIHNTAGYSRRMERAFRRFTDAYTAVSKDALRYSRSELSLLPPVYLVENGIDLSKYSHIAAGAAPFEILSVGRFERQKNYTAAARFLAPFLLRHSDVKWVIFGDYERDSGYFNEVKSEFERLNILDRVEIMGVVTDAEEIYRHGRVFLLSSSYEGFALAVIEAMMSSHFVFSPSVGIVPDILENGGIVHDIYDEESLSVLDAIYSGTYQSDELDINRKIVSSRYSLDNMVNGYLEVYRKVMESEK